MNSPGGVTLRDGQVVDVDVWQVFFNQAFWYEALHMLLAAYVVAGFTVAGVYAVGMLRGRRDGPALTWLFVLTHRGELAEDEAG